MSGSGKPTISFKYDDNGIRTKKTHNGLETTYSLDVDGNVIYETNSNDAMHYTYDETDSPVSMNLNGTDYYYVKNLQGDIISIINASGTAVVNYLYDSWGKLISTTGSLASTVGVKNPYRYRGYRYDTETELYYLQSRYYNPEWGRFLNPDIVNGVQGLLISHNLFAYCCNNSINEKDSNGYIIDVLADIFFIGWDVGDIINNPASVENWGAFGLDVACAFCPIVTGGGRIFKGAKALTKGTDKARDISKAAKIGMNNVRVLHNTKYKKYVFSMDLERGGSNLINIHLMVNGTKYRFVKKADAFLNNGKRLPNALRGNPTIVKALNKANKLIKQGW